MKNELYDLLHEIVDQEFDEYNKNLFEREGKLIITDILLEKEKLSDQEDINPEFRFIDTEKVKLGIELIALITGTIKLYKTIKDEFFNKTNEPNNTIIELKSKWKNLLMVSDMSEEKANRIVSMFSEDIEKIIKD